MGKTYILTPGKEYSPQSNENILFLFGPNEGFVGNSTRLLGAWDDKVIAILQSLNFEGVICIREPRVDYNDQMKWEEKWLQKATTIIFWIGLYEVDSFPPRKYDTTTNIEFGQWISLGEPKVMFGRPDDAHTICPNDWYARKNKVRIFNNLKELLECAI